MMTQHENLLEWVRLIRSPHIGPVTFWRLVQRHGSVSEALSALPHVSDRLDRPMTICHEEIAAQEIETAQKRGIHIIPAFHADYPKSLKHIPDVPPILFVMGQREALNRPTIGIVGARNSSLVARRFTEHFAKEMGEAGYMTSSGLARGIDRHVHLGSLNTGTIAVVAGGVDVIYPPEHRDLHEKIQRNGCIISEMPVGLHPGATHFPRRNRIISGLSDGVVVIEAALKSGSLITARYALEQDRELFAMPGSPQDPRCQGTNDLIKKGAHLIQSTSDVLEVLFSLPKVRPSVSSPLPIHHFEESAESYEAIMETEFTESDPQLTQLIIRDLSYTPINIDFLVQQYQVPVSQILSALLDLELVGLIVRFANGSVALQEEYHEGG